MKSTNAKHRLFWRSQKLERVGVQRQFWKKTRARMNRKKGFQSYMTFNDTRYLIYSEYSTNGPIHRYSRFHRTLLENDAWIWAALWRQGTLHRINWTTTEQAIFVVKTRYSTQSEDLAWIYTNLSVKTDTTCCEFGELGPLLITLNMNTDTTITYTCGHNIARANHTPPRQITPSCPLPAPGRSRARGGGPGWRRGSPVDDLTDGNFHCWYVACLSFSWDTTRGVPLFLISKRGELFLAEFFLYGR